jgi:hypothetical protein
VRFALFVALLGRFEALEWLGPPLDVCKAAWPADGEVVFFVFPCCIFLLMITARVELGVRDHSNCCVLSIRRGHVGPLQLIFMSGKNELTVVFLFDATVPISNEKSVSVSVMACPMEAFMSQPEEGEIRQTLPPELLPDDLHRILQINKPLTIKCDLLHSRGYRFCFITKIAQNKKNNTPIYGII